MVAKIFSRFRSWLSSFIKLAATAVLAVIAQAKAEVIEKCAETLVSATVAAVMV